MTMWYATKYVDDRSERKDTEEGGVWTISTDPNKPGWETDSGCPGYGMEKEHAEFAAHAMNCFPVLAKACARWFRIATSIGMSCECNGPIYGPGEQCPICELRHAAAVASFTNPNRQEG